MILQQTLFQQIQIQEVPYVSTDLRMVNVPVPDAKHRDLQIEDTWYRKLDAQYFVWIEGRIAIAEKSAKKNRISKKALQSLKSRFKKIEVWVDENLSPKNLKAARALVKYGSYDEPPAASPKPINRVDEKNKCKRNSSKIKNIPKSEPFLYPDGSYWEHTVPIDPDVVKIINAIREEALSKGWAEASLYQNRGHFIAGKWYGLICMLDKTDKIIKIDPQYIHIRTFKGSAIPPEGMVVKFENPNHVKPNGEQTKK